MPPKEGKSVKKPLSIVIDGVDTAEMTREKLEQFATKVKEELDKEREERNYFQLERDKIRTFWEITKNQLDEAKAELKNKERATEEEQEANEALILTEKQRIKSLIYDQQSAEATLKAENLVALKAAEEQHLEMELSLFCDKRQVRQETKENVQRAQDELRRAKEKQAVELEQALQEFEVRAEEILKKTQKKLAETKYLLTVSHRTELAEIEERKNKQLSELIAHHNRAYTDLKSYYNDITLNNLGLISSLKKQMEDMTIAKERADKITKEATQGTKGLQGPLQIAIAENKELRRQMSNYDRDKASLATKTKQLILLDNQFELLKDDYGALQTRFDRVLGERDEFRARFARAVQEVQAKAASKTASMEAKVCNLEKEDQAPVNLVQILKIKDEQVEDLRYEAARLRKAHDDLLTTYEAKLSKLGVPQEELGFKPLRAVPVAGLNPVLGQAPAGLVTKNP